MLAVVVFVIGTRTVIVRSAMTALGIKVPTIPLFAYGTVLLLLI